MQHKLAFLSQQRDLLPTRPPESQVSLRHRVQVCFASVSFCSKVKSETLSSTVSPWEPEALPHNVLLHEEKFTFMALLTLTICFNAYDGAVQLSKQSRSPTKFWASARWHERNFILRNHKY
jgi:hypothetical protein